MNQTTNNTSQTTFFVDVIVPLSVANKFTYRVPKELNEQIIVGKRVIVQFGKTKFYTAIIYHVHPNPPKDYVAKYIDSMECLHQENKPTLVAQGKHKYRRHKKNLHTYR